MKRYTLQLAVPAPWLCELVRTQRERQCVFEARREVYACSCSLRCGPGYNSVALGSPMGSQMRPVEPVR